MRASALCNYLVFVELAAALGGLQAASAQTLRGRVEDAASRAGISVVEIVLLAENGRVLGRTQTDSTGAFLINWRDAARVKVQATRVGYQTTITPLFTVQAAETLTASVLLSGAPIAVEPLIITDRSIADPRSSYAAGIERRRRSGIGHFFTRDQIRAANSSEVAGLLRSVPGVTLRADQNSNALLAFSGSNASSGMGSNARGQTITTVCPMTIFLNGRIHRNPMEGVNILATWEIEAIEVYRNMTEVPSEFSGSHARCGVIAIWSARRL